MLPTTDHVIDGVRCAVYDSAPGGGEAVVFVHGNPGPMDDWEDLIPAVAPLARVVAMDLPGYGRADHPRTFDYTIDGYARYLGKLLDRLAVGRAHLVLHDFGGLRWAASHPDRAGSVVLVNTGVLEGYKWHGFARVWQTPVLGELAQLAATKWGMKRALNAMSPKPLPDAFYDRVWRYSDWGHRRAVLKLYRASRTVGRRAPALPGSAAALPVCVIWGAGDPFVPVEFAERQKRYFPAAEVHVLPGLGHWPFIDSVEAVRTPLVEFLARQVAA
ncbi:MAG TPA: alpha/beta hydrolase [Urbifossiella sp.]|nr:alpha/beta hydrolase [Urbifossiella sp.]